MCRGSVVAYSNVCPVVEISHYLTSIQILSYVERKAGLKAGEAFRGVIVTLDALTSPALASVRLGAKSSAQIIEGGRQRLTT
jgi:hypothetical protein